MALGLCACSATPSNPFALSAGTEGAASSAGAGTTDAEPQTTSISDSGDSAGATTDPSAPTTSTGDDATTDAVTSTEGSTSQAGGTDTTGALTAATGGTTDPSTTASTTGSVIEVGFGDCANNATAAACLTDELCILDDVGDPTLGVCSDQGCADATDCPTPPPGGNAVVTCAELSDNMVNDCYLDCSNGEDCPTGMRCGGGFICIYDVIGADPIGFGDCFNNPGAEVCLFDEGCLSDQGPTASVCSEDGCASAADCPQPPAGGTAPVTCTDITGDLSGDCYLDCSAGQTCPTGMLCVANLFCGYS